MDNIRKKVKTHVTQYKTNDPFKLAQKLDLTVLEYDFLPGTKGLVVMVNGYTVIGINKNMSDKEKRAALAHEIGHAVLHWGIPVLNVRKRWNGKLICLRRRC